MSKLNNFQKCEIIRKQCISDWWQEQEKGADLASSRDRKEASVAEAQQGGRGVEADGIREGGEARWQRPRWGLRAGSVCLHHEGRG